MAIGFEIWFWRWSFVCKLFRTSARSRRHRPAIPILSDAEEVIDMLKFTIGLPASPAKDLGARELHVVINGGPEAVQNLAATDTQAFVVADRGATVALFLVDVDTSGNKSEPSDTLTFTAADTFPPAKPGPLAVLDGAEDDG